MFTLITFVAVIIVFGMLVMVHEAGHMFAAKRVGITVHEFSMGFGPKIFGFTRGETLYSVRIIPLGGYVRMAGGEDGQSDLEGAYYKKTVSQRAAVALAGPLMNLVLAAVLFMIVFSVLGIPFATGLIGEVLPGSPAAEAGLLSGDRIVAINDRPVQDWQQMVGAIQESNSTEGTLNLVVERGGNQLDFKVIPKVTEQVPRIGIVADVGYQRAGPLTGIKLGFTRTVELTWVMLVGLSQMFTGGVEAGDIAGPVGIIQMIGESARGGWIQVLSFAGILSINFAILNLLPIPALDGSKLVFLAIEKVRGRAIEPEREGMIHLIGFALLMGLVLVLTYQDVMRIFIQGS
jgi:regulator of sigma E protease